MEDIQLGKNLNAELEDVFTPDESVVMIDDESEEMAAAADEIISVDVREL